MKVAEKEIANQIKNELETMKWIKKNPKKDLSRWRDKDMNIEAFVLGKVWAYHSPVMVNSQYNKRYEMLYKLLKKWVKIHNPKFKYTSIQLNKSVHTHYHRDLNNIGDSYCIALGDFEGGGIQIDFGDGEGGDGFTKDYPNKNKWLLYDGHTYLHKSIKPKGRGTRYAIIFFSRM